MYEVFDHTADLGLRIRTRTLPELFEEAGAALYSLIVANPADVQCIEEHELDVEGKELDYLLFDWLSELLYLFSTQRLLLVRFQVTCQEGGLHAACAGERIDVARHRLEHEVKAITYHGLKVEREGETWLAEVIVDI